MRRIRIALIALATIAMSSTVLGQELQQAATQLEVPTYDKMTLNVYGSPVFRYVKNTADVAKKEGTDTKERMVIGLSSDFELFHQDWTNMYYVTNSLHFDGEREDDKFTWDALDSVEAGYHVWLLGQRGIHIGVDLGIGVKVDKGGDATNYAFGGRIQAGYGREIDATALAIANAMFEAVNKTASASDLSYAADYIGRYKAGEYDAKHKDSIRAKAQYYADLGDVLGTTNLFLIQEIQESPIYNIGSRRSGFQVDAEFAVISGALGDPIDYEFLPATNSNDDSADCDPDNLNGDPSADPPIPECSNKQERTDKPDMYAGEVAKYSILFSDNMGLSIEQTFRYGITNNNDLDGNDGATGIKEKTTTDPTTDIKTTIPATPALVNEYAIAPKEGHIDLGLAAEFNIDHSIHWNSKARATFGMDLSANDEKDKKTELTWSVNAESYYAMNASLLAYAKATVYGGNKASPTEGEIGYSAECGIMYYIF